MSGLVEAATAILRASERRLEAVSANVANATTPAYKRQVTFADVTAAGDRTGAPAIRSRPDLAQGKLGMTGNPMDLAISGAGFFQLRDGSGIVYSRGGQFKLAADGSVVDGHGHALQQAGGGDLMLDHAGVTIAADGTVLDGERPVGRIALFAPGDPASVQALAGSAFRFADGATEEVADPQVRQGMVEASNVAIGDEMVTMMAALRQAEGGSRLVQTYDDLLGKAIGAFGQGGR